MNRLTENSTEETRKNLAMEIYGYRKVVQDKLEKLTEDDIIKPYERVCLNESVVNIEIYRNYSVPS